MSEILFEGKKYADIDLYSQKVLEALNIHTFRYFPKDRVWMGSDTSVAKFHINKFYKIIDKTSGPAVISPKDREKEWNLYAQISHGTEDIVSERLRSVDENVYFKITLAVLERDEEGIPEIIAGIIENYDEKMTMSGVLSALAENYYSVLSVDFTKDEVTPYRLLDVIQSNYGDDLANKPKYAEMFSKYINSEVVEEERAEMFAVTSKENIIRELSVKKAFVHDFRILRGGDIIYIRMKAVKMNTDTNVDKVIIGFSNVNGEKAEAWERLVFFDQITLGTNFNYYSDSIKKVNTSGSVVSMDIRSFKLVNETGGVEKGDSVLRAASKIVEKNVDDLGFYGHVNADHFVFYLKTTDEEEVKKVLDGIIGDFRVLVREEAIPSISPYFGVTRWNPGSRIQVVFSEANAAKHRIKTRKDVSYGFYRDEDNKALLIEKLIEDSFEEAINERQFEIWYQPKYSPADRKMIGAEALVRWRKDDGSLVPPGKFIPVYEKNGMIRQLDAYVFNEVCSQQKKWIETFGSTIPVSINLSRASMYYSGTVNEYKAIADEVGVLPQLLPIEITESVAVANNDIKALADNFYEAGFPLYIDDFGTGYSSLSTLNMMRFDTLKLDKSLIDFVGEYRGDSLIKHTIALAKDLGLHVTAEGVESENQVDFLKKVDCDSIQGYFFDKPMPVAEFEQKLKNNIVK